MQLQDAINLVQQKFQEESQGNTEGDAVDKWADAFEQFPVMMETATHIWAQQIITQNYHRALAQQQAAQQAAEKNLGDADATPTS